MIKLMLAYRRIYSYCNVTFMIYPYFSRSYPTSALWRNHIVESTISQKQRNHNYPLYSFLPSSKKQYHSTTIRAHRFSSKEAGLKVNIVMEYADVKSGLADKSIALIDVRNPDELVKHGKIPGSINIPLPELSDALELSEDNFTEKYGNNKPKLNDKIATHCMMGGRAGKAADALKTMGFCNAVSYSGSFKDWKSKGGAIEGGGDSS